MATVGRYKQVQVYVREFDDVKVVLLNQETIYALPTHGTYPEWRRFRKAVRYNRRLTPKKIHTLAMRHGIQSFGTQRSPNLEGKKVKYENLKRKDRNEA